MSTPKYTKVIGCHNGLQINGICFYPECNGSLLCMSCVLTSPHCNHIKNILSIPQVAEKADKHYGLMREIRSEDDVPEEVQDLLDNEDESLTNLTKHIEQEKQHVEKIISEIQQSFLTTTNSFKETISKQFDAQLETMKANFNYLKTKVKRFYRQDEAECLDFPCLEEIMKSLNIIDDKTNLQAKLKHFYEEINFGAAWSGTLEEKIAQTESTINDISQLFQELLNLKPTTCVFNELRANIHNYLNDFTITLENRHLFANEINILRDDNIKPMVKSNLVTSSLDQILIQDWLPGKVKSCTLIYQGSRDGFASLEFHKKVDNYKHTLTIVESNFGKIFGGYSDQLWESAKEPCKKSITSFLFSITGRELYPVKRKLKRKAIDCNKDHSASFGDSQGAESSGGDLKIANNGNSNTDSYSKLGSCYESKGKSGEFFVGAESFSVKEIEVFSVEFYTEIRTIG
jgi:cell division protein ZapA (FtsZ GTPase activity inhibitor)